MCGHHVSSRNTCLSRLSLLWLCLLPNRLMNQKMRFRESLASLGQCPPPPFSSRLAPTTSPPLPPDSNSCCQHLRVFCVTHHLNMVQTKVPCLSLLLVLELFCDTCTGGNTRMTSLSSQPHCSPVGLSSQQADDNPTVC